MRRVTIRLPANIHRRLELYAQRRGVTVSVLVRMLVSASMDREP